MNPKLPDSPVSRLRHALRLVVLLAVQLLLCLPTQAQLVSSGFPVTNPNWQILITPYGYADLALDRRPGFVGREYLSGEWAAAVLYTGGQNPTNAIWFQPQWFFPDWVSDSNFGVELTVGSTGTNNANGFTVYRSVITNRDVRVVMTYEMLDTTNGIPMGTSPKSLGGPGSSVLSDRYVFRQTYRITNISGGPLNNFRFYQFLHGLEMTNSIYDDRMYAGAMSSYRYDNTQQGQAYSFHSGTGETYLHRDKIGFHSMLMPTTWEVGYYGKEGVDDHMIGKPSVGVHLKVEMDTLNTNVDNFTPPETHWVSGAERLSLNTLAAGGTTNLDFLLSLSTTSTVAYPPLNIIIRNVQVKTNKVLIDFQETTSNPQVGFILRKSTNVNQTPITSWEQVFIPYIINFPQAGWNRFEALYSPTVPRCFFRVEAIIQN